MSSVHLRDYQVEAVLSIENEWDKGRLKTLLVLPTGCGKTLVFSEVAKRCVDRGERVLILAHRAELLTQAAEKLHAVSGLMCATEKADETSIGRFEAVVVGSVQTLMRDSRLEALGKNRFSTIIVDEAHHILSDSYQKVLSFFEDAKVLGVTATPDRGDRKNLGAFFDSLAYEYTLPKAIKAGYLCPIEAQTIPLEIDLNSVSVQSGDFKTKDIGKVLDPYLEQIADEMVKAACKNRKTVVFLPLIETSKKFARMLKTRGFFSLEVNGESEDRAETLATFDASGAGTVLCNSMLLTEGWDCPSVDCVIVLRPTKVRSLYSQMLGRGTRLSPQTGKTKLLVLDFLWHTDRLELCRPAYLVAGTDEVARAMTKTLEDGNTYDLSELEVEAVAKVAADREESLARKLAEMRHKKRKLVDPLQFEMSIEDADLIDYTPTFAWEMAPATDKQLTALESFGIFSETVENAGKASLLLNRLNKRKEEGLSTAKQIRFLESRGFRHVGTWTSSQASSLIGIISSHGWRVPKHITPSTYTPST